MSPDPQNITPENSNRNAGNAEIYNDDSGVSVSGNLSQSDSTSGSGSDGESGTTDFVNEGNSITNEEEPDEVNNQERENLGANSEDDDGPNNQNRHDVDANPAINMNNRQEEGSVNRDLLEVQCKAERLADFIISQTLGSNAKPQDEVEETLLRCTKALTTKHEILFNGMMRRIRINEDNAYNAFITVVNELFEGERQVFSWGRIVTFYAFGGQLALYCREEQLVCGQRIPMYVGRYAKEVISNFVSNEGGWTKLCEEFPPEDEFENTVWRVLTWTAIGLGLATAASFLASN